MAHYIGLDVHLQSCTFKAVTERGRPSKAVVVRTKGSEIVAATKSFPTPRVLCMEEGTMSEWLSELLRPHVDDLIVVQPKKRSGNKSDEADALGLAEDACRGHVKRVFKPYGQLSELRTAARNYDECQRDVVRAKNRLLAAFRMRGIRLPKDYSDEDTREQLMELLKPPYSLHAAALSKRLDATLGAREEAREWLEKSARKVSAVKLLMSLPGIGVIRAAQIVAVVVTPSRFRTRAEFWSYCGLAITSYSSADWKEDKSGALVRSKRNGQVRGLNRNRNPVLKNVFVSAARTVIAMPDHPLAENYRRLVASGMDENNALITTARRIAAAARAVWLRKEEYDPAKHVARNATT